jgi:hypothetical protein
LMHDIDYPGWRPPPAILEVVTPQRSRVGQPTGGIGRPSRPRPHGSPSVHDEREAVWVEGTSSKDRILGPPDRGKKAGDRPPRGRMCIQVGCQTILSTYNSSEVCWLHAPPAYRHALRRD